MFQSLDLFSLESWERFENLCFCLARAKHWKKGEHAVLFGHSWDGGRDVMVYVYTDGRPAQRVALQCKFVRSTSGTTKRSITESLDALCKLPLRPERWILCMPINPTGKFMDWFMHETSKRQISAEVWGRSELIALLEEHQHVFQTFFYRVFAELERAFVSDNLELERFELDPECQWRQRDPKLLSFFSTGNVASSDLVFDVVVRNTGNLEAALFKLIASVFASRPIPHGFPGEGLLLPKITYGVSVGHGTSGRYEAACEPPLLVAPRSHQRFKVKLTETGYSWGGSVQLELVYGQKSLALPCVELLT